MLRNAIREHHHQRFIDFPFVISDELRSLLHAILHSGIFIITQLPRERNGANQSNLSRSSPSSFSRFSYLAGGEGVGEADKKKILFVFWVCVEIQISQSKDIFLSTRSAEIVNCINSQIFRRRKRARQHRRKSKHRGTIASDIYIYKYTDPVRAQ